MSTKRNGALDRSLRDQLAFLLLHFFSFFLTISDKSGENFQVSSCRGIGVAEQKGENKFEVQVFFFDLET